jgi:Restriction endonuclease
MSSARPTKTTNPLHFEDLDPRRFEDLIRELIYDFRDWQTIEATGKAGSDDGFDIRAFERTTITSVDEDGNEMMGPKEGNLWMVQCKREKKLSPSQIKKILADVDPSNPPYGYILAAATTFSKRSYDTFRAELTELGVMEFHLWGNAFLETELYQPKNDRILFTFFGISNVRRMRSRATDIRSEVSIKNKIMRILGDDPAYKWILVRDAKDDNYPNEDRYPDFATNPRWRSFEIIEMHPRGLIVRVKCAYGFVDEAKKCFDIIEPEIVQKNPYDRWDEFNRDRASRDHDGKARDFWERLPSENQVMYELRGIIRFRDILVLDEKGDSRFEVPHLFVDFEGGSPISGSREILERGKHTIELGGFSRCSFFPSELPDPMFGTIYDDVSLPLAEAVKSRILSFHDQNSKWLFDGDGRFSHLQPFDVAVVRSSQDRSRYLQITHRYQLSAAKLLQDNPEMHWQLHQHLDREPSADEIIEVLEYRDCYEHQWSKGH